MFKRILIPVDFTKKNLTALDMTARIAKVNPVEVTLLHVIEQVEHLSAKELKPFYGRLEKNARTKLNALTGRLRKNETPVEAKIVFGKRVEEIVKYAIQEQIDLIIMSSHQISPAHGWGALSYQVAILSPCSVLLVK